MANQHITTTLYGNCLMLSMKGKPLCRTSKDRMEWYLKRNLATKIKHNVFKLNFFSETHEPNHEFFIEEKGNNCVCCNSTSFLNRHHVVPYCYRKFFPQEYKARCSYDVLPLCITCHSKYENEALKLKKRLASLLPQDKLFDEKHIKYVLEHNRNVNLFYLLKNNKDSLPKKRIKEIETRLLSSKLITNLKDIETKDVEKIEPLINDLVRAKEVLSQYDIEEFILLWRNHFVDTLKPEHLPKSWNTKDIVKSKL